MNLNSSVKAICFGGQIARHTLACLRILQGLVLTVSVSRSVCAQELPEASAPPPAEAQHINPTAPAVPDAAASKLFSIPSQNGPAADAGSGDGYQLNFVDTEIASVIGAVLGDGLGMPFVVDPQIKGTITLQATRPLSREETLAALETALRVQGAAMVQVGGVLNIVPAKDAPKRITNLRLSNQNEPGFGIYVVPLQYVGAQDMEKVLLPFAPDGGILRVDAARNLLLLAGTRQEVATLLNVVNTFDVNWLTGMSFAIYQLENVDAKSLATELGEVFSDSRSPIAGVVRIVPLTRLNSLMVITPQEKYLQEVQGWIKRLDIATAAPGRRIYVYDVQNGKADELAKSLSNILSLASASTTPSTMTEATAAPTGSQRTVGGAATTANTITSPIIAQQDSGTSAAGVKIVPNAENNSLLIMATPSEYGVIDVTLKKLDVVPIQVLIEASIAEVTLTDDLRFGLQWSYQSGKGPIVYSEAGAGTINQQFPGLSFLYTGRPDIRAVLNSLESLTNVRVLSSPKLMVLNNREAQLQIGDQVPITTQSAISTSASTAPIVNSVQLRDTGVILRVTPRVNKNGRIYLDVAQEVSNVVPTSTSGIDSPTIQQRKISSTISVENGETIAIGGMIKESQTKSRTGIPILRRIPLIGALFGSTVNGKVRTELIVLLSPRIVRSTQESNAATRELQMQFEDLRRALPNWGKKPSLPRPTLKEDGKGAASAP